jgi:hypothetical protein
MIAASCGGANRIMRTNRFPAAKFLQASFGGPRSGAVSLVRARRVGKMPISVCSEFGLDKIWASQTPTLT